MFKDKFGKWPRIMRLLVLFSLLPPLVAFILVQNNITTYQSLHNLLVSIASLNAFLLFWGLLLKIRRASTGTVITILAKLCCLPLSL